jgi:endonuclease IV
MIGIHVHKCTKFSEKRAEVRKDMTSAIINDVHNLKINTIQIFTHGPRNAKENKIDYSVIKKHCLINNIKIYVHSSYVTSGIWNINKLNRNTEKSQNIIQHFENQLISCARLSACGLVVHLPKKTQSDILHSLKILSHLINKYKICILLEMTSTTPHYIKTYETPKKLNRLCTTLSKVKYWALCIDTAHLWGSGIKINNTNIMRKWLRELNNPEKIKLFHINGSPLKIFNTGADKHIIPFSKEDGIWKWCKSEIDKTPKTSFGTLVNFAKLYKIPSIYEINRGSYADTVNAIKIFKYINKSMS